MRKDVLAFSSGGDFHHPQNRGVEYNPQCDIHGMKAMVDDMVI